MIPAPMTAMVRTSAIELLPFFQLLDDIEEVGVGLAHVFGEALFLLAGELIKTAVDAAQSCRDVVYIIHHADKFTSSSHNVLSSKNKRIRLHGSAGYRRKAAN